MDNSIKNKLRSIAEKNKSVYLIVVIIILVLLVLGGTYAYFAMRVFNNVIGGHAANVNLDLVVTKVLPETEDVDDIIVTNFSNLAESLNNSCVYDEDFATCQLYRINLSNNSTELTNEVKGSIAFNIETAPNLSWILIDNYDSSTTYTDDMMGSNFNTASTEFVSFVDSYILEPDTDVVFYILVWVNESEEMQTDNGTFSGSIKFEDANGLGVTSAFNGL